MTRRTELPPYQISNLLTWTVQQRLTAASISANVEITEHLSSPGAEYLYEINHFYIRATDMQESLTSLDGPDECFQYRCRDALRKSVVSWTSDAADQFCACISLNSLLTDDEKQAWPVLVWLSAEPEILRRTNWRCPLFAAEGRIWFRPGIVDALTYIPVPRSRIVYQLRQDSANDSMSIKDALLALQNVS